MRRDGEPTQLSHFGLHSEHRFPAPYFKDEGCRKPVLGVCVSLCYFWIKTCDAAMPEVPASVLVFLQKSYESHESVCVRVSEVAVRNQKTRSADNDFSELCEVHI